MVTLLEDKKFLLADARAQSAVKKLTQVNVIDKYTMCKFNKLVKRVNAL